MRVNEVAEELGVSVPYPRVYKALRDQLAAVLDELRRIEAGGSVSDELLDVIEMIAAIMDGMKEENAHGE